MENKLTSIFSEVFKEYTIQNDKYKNQSYPMLEFPCTQELILNMKEDFNLTMYKAMSYRDCLSWYAILQEAVYDVFSETQPVLQRENMIKATAIAFSIIEYLDKIIEGINHE